MNISCSEELKPFENAENLVRKLTVIMEKTFMMQTHIDYCFYGNLLRDSKVIAWRLSSIDFDHYLLEKSSIGKR